MGHQEQSLLKKKNEIDNNNLIEDKDIFIK